MPLNLITGPVNSGKAAIVLDAVAEAAAAGDDPILVVPTRADSDLLRRELAAGSISQAVRVTRFRGLWELIARRVGFDARPLDDFGCQRIARAVTDQALAEGQLQVLEQSARTGGFASALARFAAELGEVRASPQKFATAMEAWQAASAGRDGYGLELALLYRTYRERLQRLGLRDASGYLTELLDQFERGPELWRRTPVYFYGFDDFELRQLDTIAALSGCGAEVTVSIPFEQRAAFEARERIVAQLRALPDSVETQSDASSVHYAASSRDALFGLEQGLFEERFEAINPGEAIERFRSGGPRAELELIAARIAALHDGGSEDGLEYEQIAVAVRDLDDAAPLIAEVFAAADVPIALRRRVPIGHTALVRGFLSLLDCALCEDTAADRSGLLVAKLVAWLRTPGVTASEFRGRVDRLEAKLLRGELGTLFAAEEAWSEISGQPQNFALEGLRAGFAKGPGEGYRKAGEQARRLLAATAQEDRHGCAPVFAAGELRDAAALGELIKAFDQLDRLVARDATLAPGSGQLLAELGGRTLASGESLIPGAVSIATPLALRARRVEALFVARLQEGAFPRTLTEDPFLDDRDRANINRAARGAGLKALWPSDPVDRVAAERHLLHALLSRATKLLVYSSHTHSEAGDPANPSLFIDDIEDLLAPAPEPLSRALGQIDWPPNDKLRPSPYQSALAAVREGRRHTDRPYKLLDQTAIDAVSSRDAWSATSIEAYLRCPMAWLVDRFLRPDELEPEAAQLSFGTAAHNVVQGLFERFQSEQLVLDGASVKRALQLVDELVAEHKAISPDPVTDRIERRRLRRAAAAYLVHAASSGSEFVPGDFELSFGIDGAPPVDLGDGLLLSGKIDRVDLLGNAAIIVDYKTGKIGSEQSRINWAKKGLLQLALYALAYETLKPGKQVVGALYQPIGDRETKDLRPRGAIRDDVDVDRTDIVKRSDRVSDEDFARLLSEALKVASGAIAAIGRGELEPTDPTKCAYGRDGGCAYPGICRRLA